MAEVCDVYGRAEPLQHLFLGSAQFALSNNQIADAGDAGLAKAFVANNTLADVRCTPVPTSIMAWLCMMAILTGVRAECQRDGCLHNAYSSARRSSISTITESAIKALWYLRRHLQPAAR